MTDDTDTESDDRSGPDDTTGIPRERDRATGEAGDLGVWEDDPALRPAEVWDSMQAVFTHPTHSRLGEHFATGDDIVVVFHDRALVCTVTAVEGGEDDA